MKNRKCKIASPEVEIKALNRECDMLQEMYINQRIENRELQVTIEELEREVGNLKVEVDFYKNIKINNEK